MVENGHSAFFRLEDEAVGALGARGGRLGRAASSEVDFLLLVRDGGEGHTVQTVEAGVGFRRKREGRRAQFEG